MREAVDGQPGYPRILFFHQGSIEAGEEFFDDFWPEARAVADPESRFYGAFEVRTASPREIFGPKIWLKAMIAARKGNRLRKIVGDPWDMPGLFLVREDRVLWTWRFRDLGDHPTFELLPRLMLETG